MKLFNEIHEIVFHGGGGYTWEQVYNMPIWLRRFTWNKLIKWFTPVDENEESWLNKGVKDKVKKENTKIKPPSYVTSRGKKK